MKLDEPVEEHSTQWATQSGTSRGIKDGNRNADVYALSINRRVKLEVKQVLNSVVGTLSAKNYIMVLLSIGPNDCC